MNELRYLKADQLVSHMRRVTVTYHIYASCFPAMMWRGQLSEMFVILMSLLVR